MLIRILRPLILIRIGRLISGRIGHFAANTELYLCEKELGIQPSKAFDIFYLVPPLCNIQLSKMWSRKLRIMNFVSWIDRLNRHLPGGRMHQVNFSSDIDTDGLIARTPAHISFTRKEEVSGREALGRLGIFNGASFVCFYARDSAYLANEFCSQDWRYHNYRDSKIGNYLLSAEELARRGYFAVRMGSVVEEPLNGHNPKIIDYALNGRSDFLDIFLTANCSFFVCSTGGLNALPRIFRRPVVYVNFIPLGTGHIFSCAPGSLVIPKKIIWKHNKRLVRLEEIKKFGIESFYRTQDYENFGLELLENSPEEILAVVTEMEERLKGSWNEGPEDRRMQERFWFLLRSEKYKGRIPSMIGADFLRQNSRILN